MGRPGPRTRGRLAIRPAFARARTRRTRDAGRSCTRAATGAPRRDAVRADGRLGDLMSNSNDPFVNYYADAALKPETLDRFAATKRAVMAAARHFGLQGSRRRGADIGCGAATQCAMWGRDGDTGFGGGINTALVELGRQRMAAEKLDVSLSIGSATQLPWPDASMDVCLCPELLEHVADWQPVIREAVRVLKPGGVLYLSTTNLLCPVQEEFA